MSFSQLCDVEADGSGLLGQTVVFSMFVGARHGCLRAGSMCPVIRCERECQPSIEYCVPDCQPNGRTLEYYGLCGAGVDMFRP